MQDADLPVDEVDEISDLLDEIAREQAEAAAGAAAAVTAQLADEPLFLALLRPVMARLWPGDVVMADFLTLAGRLSDELGHCAAKGGEFVARRRAQNQAVEAHYLHDQSMRAHLVNGLLPVLRLAAILQDWQAPQFQVYDMPCRRIFIAGYVLHDYLKLPGVEAQLEATGFSHASSVGPAQMALLAEIFQTWGQKLALEAFLAPAGGLAACLDDLIYIACNTQTRWGTLRNLQLLPNLQLSPVQLDLAEQLSRMADLLAYVGKTPPQVAAHPALQRELAILSNQTARWSYHHLAEQRGVLSNFIQNAALQALSGPYRQPLLYAPSGVVYLEHRQLAPAVPDLEQIAGATLERIRQRAGLALGTSLTGFKRDGKGLKHAEYYWLFYDLPTFIRLGAEAAGKKIGGKNPVAGKRFEKMRTGNWLADDVDLDLPQDGRVDLLAEWCFLAEKQVAAKCPAFDVPAFLLHALDLDDLCPTFLAIPRDQRAGGVGYHWYLAAGQAVKRHPGLDPAAWQERLQELAGQLAGAVDVFLRAASSGEQTTGGDDWDDLRAYIGSILTLGPGGPLSDEHASFLTELQRYTNAKRKGHGRTAVCGWCSSSYRIGKQREAAVLFAPQVYSNKRPLHSTDAIREICSICSMEMMLRQILMNRSAASGGDFEGRRLRYLFFYPTYFFTPETLGVLRRLYPALQNIRFPELRRCLEDEDGLPRLTPQVLQRLEPLLLKPQEKIMAQEDRFLRLHLPETDPITFYFLGVPPPGREAKDAEAWVNPAFLALLLPLCLDVKVVASETALPLMAEADEITETVFLDSPHAAIQYLLSGQTRISIDHLLPAVRRLIVSYLIHLDANAHMSAGFYDYRWQDLPALARNLDQSSLYVFYYLKKWQRRQSGSDSLPQKKIRQYLYYARILKGEADMSHARNLTLLYRQFYRAKRYNSNSILRPISIAARTILEADLRLFDQAGLVEAVSGELRSFAERAQTAGLAYLPRGSTYLERDRALRAFAAYFVDQVFYAVLRGDQSALRGRQLNLLKNACEVIYLDENAREQAERQADVTIATDDSPGPNLTDLQE